jgi:hypothetical protein
MLLVAGGIFREVVLDEGSGPARELRLAGSGLYAALAAARLGTEVTLLAPVGAEDERIALALCREDGVQPALLATPGVSGTFVVERRAGARPRPQYRPATAVPGGAADGLAADVVLVFGHPEWTRSPMWRCARSSTVDRSCSTGRAGCRRRPGLQPPSWAPVSAWSCATRTRRSRAHPGPRRTRSTGCPMTASRPRSSRTDWDSAIYDRDATGRTLVAPYAGRVQQTIGSGDVFAGGLAAALVRGDGLPVACEHGARAAAAWIFGDGQLPGAGFAERVARLVDAPRGEAIPPEVVRGAEAAVRRSIDLGAVLLAREVSAIVERSRCLGWCGRTAFFGPSD